MSTKGIAHRQWKYGDRQAASGYGSIEESKAIRAQDAAFVAHLRQAFQNGEFPSADDAR